MRDQFGREISTLRLSLTDRCNLRCQYCMPLEGMEWLPRDHLLSYEELLRVAALMTALGFTHFRVTGGEPLVRRDAAAFMAHLARLPGVRRVNLSTNGLLLEERLDELAAIGLGSLNVSLDSLRADRFADVTRGGDWARVWRGIEAALARRMATVKLNVVVMRGVNDDELGAFARLAAERPLAVRFIEYMPDGPWHGPEGQKVLPVAAILARLRADWPDLALRPRADGAAGPADIYAAPGWAGSIGLISPVSDRFCATCNRMRLTADGRLKGCLLTEDYVDLRAALRAGADDETLRARIRAATWNKVEHHDAARSHTMNLTGG